jgi:hypothetical protein
VASGLPYTHERSWIGVLMAGQDIGPVFYFIRRWSYFNDQPACSSLKPRTHRLDAMLKHIADIFKRTALPMFHLVSIEPLGFLFGESDSLHSTCPFSNVLLQQVVTVWNPHGDWWESSIEWASLLSSRLSLQAGALLLLTLCSAYYALFIYFYLDSVSHPLHSAHLRNLYQRVSSRNKTT